MRGGRSRNGRRRSAARWRARWRRRARAARRACSRVAGSRASAPVVSASPRKNTIRPWTWLVAAPLAAAHAEGQPPVGGGVGHGGDDERHQVRAERAEARPQQHVEQQVGERARHARSRRTATSWPIIPRGTPATSRSGVVECAAAELRAQVVQRGRGRSRARGRAGRCPCRSSTAVRTMSTDESGSSTQSTGTSWMRSPARSASTSSSVSKNQPVSSTSGTSRCATSPRMALKPHCASEKPGGERAAQDAGCSSAR